MINNISIFLMEEKKIIKREQTPNYKIKDYKNPPKKNIEKDADGNLKYRRKVIYDKDGKKNILTLAITKGEGPDGGKTKVTSKWKEKT